MSPTTLDQAKDVIEQQQKDLVQLRLKCDLLEAKLLDLVPGLMGEKPRHEHREFIARESVLGSHDQDSIAIIRVLSLATISIIMVDIIRDPHGIVFQRLYSLLVWGFTPLPVTALIWAVLSVISVIVVPLFLLWNSSRINSRSHVAAYVLTQLALWGSASITTLGVSFRPSCAIIIMAETARLSMKMHAFFVETRRYAVQSPESKLYHEAHIELISNDAALLKHYIYFLFAPTLIYRNHYPRTDATDWFKVLGYTLHTLIGIVLTGYIFCSSFLQEPSWDSWSNVLIQIMSAMIPGMALMLLAFFVILHSWFNAFAEVLQFADRQFYLRWWTARSYSSYYRRWNKVVGDWIHAYVYSGLKQNGFGSAASSMFSILLSAVVHEYIIAVSLGFFYPVMFVLFAGFGMLFMFTTNVVKKHADGWNWFLWATLFFGNGILLSLYSAEYIARTDRVTRKHHIDRTSWVPYSWQIFRSTPDH